MCVYIVYKKVSICVVVYRLCSRSDADNPPCSSFLAGNLGSSPTSSPSGEHEYANVDMSRKVGNNI